MTTPIESRIENISQCTIEELFGFLVVIMSEGNLTMAKRPPHTLLDLANVVASCDECQVGLRIIEELKSRKWKKKDLSRDRIADHAAGVQHLMCVDVEEHSTIVKDIVAGRVHGN